MKNITSENGDNEEKKSADKLVADDRSAEVDHNISEDDIKDVAEENSKLLEKPLTDQERQLLYDKGIKFKKKGNTQHALYCLLACVRGLKEGSVFQQLPECLHNIAEIYSQLEDYENAVSFAQAEKLYYETSLINVSSEVQQEQEESGFKGSTGSVVQEKNTEDKLTQPGDKDDPQGNSAEARSANEYEKLAHMCLKQKNAQLALEYCGKAVKLRQSIYGEAHPITKRTLDLFTVIYAEMGKEQYSAAMQKFNETKESSEENADKTAQPPQPKISTAENSGGDVKSSADSRQSPVGESHQGEPSAATPDAQDNQENSYRIGITPGQAMFCFFLLTTAVAVCVTLLCCHISGTDPLTTYKYIVTRLKFYYYYYLRRAPSGNKYF